MPSMSWPLITPLGCRSADVQTCWRVVGSIPAEISTASLELPEVDAAAPQSVSAAIAAVNAGQQECATALCRSGIWPASMPSVSPDRCSRLKSAGGGCCEVVPSCACCAALWHMCMDVLLLELLAPARRPTSKLQLAVGRWSASHPSYTSAWIVWESCDAQASSCRCCCVLLSIYWARVGRCCWLSCMHPACPSRSRRTGPLPRAKRPRLAVRGHLKVREAADCACKVSDRKLHTPDCRFSWVSSAERLLCSASTAGCVLRICFAPKGAGNLNKPCIRPSHAVQLGASSQQMGKALRAVQVQTRPLSHQMALSLAQTAPQMQESSRPLARAPLQRAGSSLCRQRTQPAVAPGWQAWPFL